MTAYLARGGSAALLYVIAAHGASAELTAQDVWADWQSYLTGAGYEVSATESSSGGTLTLQNVQATMKSPQFEGAFSIEMPEVVFTENADGTVAVALPSSVPMQFSAEADGDVEGVIAYTQTGNTMVVSGDPANMTYNYTAAQIEMALSSLSVDGEAAPPGMIRAVLTMNNVISSTQMTLGDMRNYSQRMNADSMGYDFGFNEPGTDDIAEFKGALQAVGFQGTGTIPADLDMSDVQALLKNGFAFEGTFTYGSGSTDMMVKGKGDDFTYTGSSQGGMFGMAMDASRLIYEVAQQGTSISLTTVELPFPVSLQMAEYGFRMQMPLAKSDEEQDFGLSIRLGEFQVPEMLWGMVDPAGALPHDPASVALDVTGKAKILVDLTDPAVAENLDDMSAPPGELNALTINELLVSAVGAKLTGTGAFTFDNTDLASFDGMPAPSGSADLQLVGVNALVDKLIQMGMMSNDDAMGARMMMGMLAVPGDAPDTLNSKIEINEQGQIMANGQRIK